MWFRPGVDSDRFRVSSFKNRIRRRKSPTKAVGVDVPPTNNENANEKIRKSSSKSSVNDDEAEKQKKILLTDRKFKNNRVQKSSSKGKISDLEKRDSLRTPRKISAPPVLVDDANKKAATSANAAAAPKKNVRAHSNLTLNTLLRYKLVSVSKKLSHEDFDRIRRKSLTDTATASRGNISRLNSVDVLEEPSAAKTSECDCNGGQADNAESATVAGGGSGRVDNVDSCDINDEEADEDDDIFHSCPEDAAKKSPSPIVKSTGKEKSPKKVKKKKSGKRSDLYKQHSFGNCHQLLTFVGLC